MATVVCANGALGIIHASSHFIPNEGFRIAGHGDNGATIGVWENPEGQQGVNDIWTIPGEEAARDAWEAEDKGNPGFPGFHHLQIQEFLRAVLEDREPAVTGAEARKSLEIILAIYESSRSGQVVRL